MCAFFYVQFWRKLSMVTLLERYPIMLFRSSGSFLITFPWRYLVGQGRPLHCHLSSELKTSPTLPYAQKHETKSVRFCIFLKHFGTLYSILDKKKKKSVNEYTDHVILCQLVKSWFWAIIHQETVTELCGKAFGILWYRPYLRWAIAMQSLSLLQHIEPETKRWQFWRRYFPVHFRERKSVIIIFIMILTAVCSHGSNCRSRYWLHGVE